MWSELASTRRFCAATHDDDGIEDSFTGRTRASTACEPGIQTHAQLGSDAATLVRRVFKVAAPRRAAIMNLSREPAVRTRRGDTSLVAAYKRHPAHGVVVSMRVCVAL